MPKYLYFHNKAVIPNAISKTEQSIKNSKKKKVVCIWNNKLLIQSIRVLLSIKISFNFDINSEDVKILKNASIIVFHYFTSAISSNYKSKAREQVEPQQGIFYS